MGSDPSGELTSESTLVFEVTFSEGVTGVDAGDFELSGTGAGSITVSAVSGDTYNATVAVNTDGTFNLNIAGGHNIEDLAGTGLSSVTPTGADQSYTVDRTAPAVTSIVGSDPSGELTSESTLVFEVTFSEDVTGVDLSDFALSSGGTGTGSVTNLAGSGSQYLVTVSAAQDGTYNLDLASSGHGIADAADNPLSSPTPTGADHTYTIDTTAPTVASIERSNPADQTTSARTLVFAVTFSEDVTGVDLSDFALSPGSTGGGSGSGQFTQTRPPALAITEDNTVSDTITVPDSGTATSVSVAIDISHTWIGDLKVDLVAPDGTTQTLHDRSGGDADDIDQTYAPYFAGVPIAGAWTLRINDNYAAADDGTLDSWTLTINYGSSSTASPVTTVSGSGDTYHVTVSAAQDGTYNLDLVSSGHGITDAASNPLSSPIPTGADHTYTVSAVPADTTAPTVTSIVRSNPAGGVTNSTSLIFAVTFSEGVTGVDLSDFALSPDSTGGGSGSGQFTQTSEPALRIADRSTIQDAIAVDQSGTATSVSVAVDITHTYIGDLVIDLIAPNGTTQTLHDRTGSSANDIDRAYTPDLGGAEIAGDWTLRVSDKAGGDTGTLNSWTLTIDHGTADSPVTGLTGSGDTYLVTVSATRDGTYNLDLASSGHGIADAADNPLSSPTPTGADHTYTVGTIPADTTAPTVASIERSDPAAETTSAQTLVFAVTFSEGVSGVDLSDFALSSGGTGTGSVTNLAGSGSQYLVNVSAAQDGTYNLDLVSSGHGITDDANNPLSSPTPTGADHTYTVTLQVTITDSPNSPPTVNAGQDQEVAEGTTVSLSGTVSDDDPEDTPTHEWTHDGPSGITFANPAALSTTFAAPDVAANTTFTVTLTANDGTVEVSDALQVTIADSPSIPPAADAGLNLTAAGSITDTGTLELLGARGITIFESGGSTYAAVIAYFDNGVQVLDVTDPSAITAAGSITDDAALKLAGASGIAVFESGGSTYAAVASLIDDGVQILNITDPSDITAAGSIADTDALELDGALGIATFESGGSTYAAVASSGDNGVQILDVTDPSAITAAGSITDTGTLKLLGARAIATFESGGSTYAAVAAEPDDGVQILDITDPSDITAAGSIADTDDLKLAGAYGITIFKSGGSTYAAVASSGDNGVQILDVTDPPAITAAGGIGDTDDLKLAGASGITTFESGGSTYAAVASYFDNGIQILDVTDPSAITAASNIGDGGALELAGAEGIAVFESGGSTYAAVASSDDNGVQILRLTGGIPPR